MDAKANAIKSLSNCLTLARDENIVEIPPDCQGWGLLKWAITAANKPLLILSAVFFFLSVNAELSGKCCGNPVAFNFLTGFSNLTVTATVWGQAQGCGVLGELFSHPLSKYKI